MKKITLKGLFFGALLSSVMLFAGCSASNSPTESTQTKTDALSHKVSIPEHPKRIIGSYLEDYLVSLDVKPVAQWTVGKGSIQHYLQDDLADIPTINFDLPYEDVLKFEPDLLLIESNSMVEGGKYAEYSKIAPTYVVKNGDKVTWQEKLEDIASVLGKTKKADQVIDTYEELVTTTKEQLKDKISGKSAAVLWVTNNSAFMVAENRSSGNLLYDQLGFEVPNLTKEISKSASSDWSPVSLEKLATLDADYLILVNSDKSAAMFKDQIWQNIPAVKAGNLWEFGPETSWLYNGPIAYTQMIEDIQEKLEK